MKRVQKKVIAGMEKCYAIAPLFYREKKHLLVASERSGGCVLFDSEGRQETILWREPGGTMSMMQVPGTDGWFLAVQKFYSPDDAEESELVLAIPGEDGVWERRTFLKLPFLHRFDILFRNGTYYLIACTIKSGCSHEGDWSKPGKVYGGVLPKDLREWRDGCIELTVLAEKMTQNHGYSKIVTDGVEKALVSAGEGVFLFTPPRSQGKAWEWEQILDIPASDAVLVDLDGDGGPELGVIHPFHGDKVSIFKKEKGRYAECYTCEEKMEFSHAIFGGTLWGQPSMLIGSRMGKQVLAVFWYNKKTKRYQKQVLDEGCGAANVFYDPAWNERMLIAANREKDEVAMYLLEEEK